MPKKYDKCSQCGKPMKMTEWKFCSWACKEARTREYTALGAATRRRVAGERVQHPLVLAIADGNPALILGVLREICHVTPRGCWVAEVSFSPEGYRWVYDADGYRAITFGGRTYRLHRVALECASGVTLGRLASHHVCAVRPCCNPEHLQPATAIENNLEMMERTAYRQRIADLEAALAMQQPGHRLLAERVVDDLDTIC